MGISHHRRKKKLIIQALKRNFQRESPFLRVEDVVFAEKVSTPFLRKQLLLGSHLYRRGTALLVVDKSGESSLKGKQGDFILTNK